MLVAAQVKIFPKAQVSGQILRDAFMKSLILRMIGMVHNVDIDTEWAYLSKTRRLANSY